MEQIKSEQAIQTGSKMGPEALGAKLVRRVTRPWDYADLEDAQIPEGEGIDIARRTLARAIDDVTHPARHSKPLQWQEDAWAWLLTPLYVQERHTVGMGVEECAEAAGLPVFGLLQALILASCDELDALFGRGAGERLKAESGRRWLASLN